MSNTAALDLLDAAGRTTTGNDMIWPGGDGTLFVDSTGFNGATVTLQAKLPAGSYAAVGSNTTFTAAGLGNFYLPPCTIRVAISVATPSAAVFARAVRINP